MHALCILSLCSSECSASSAPFAFASPGFNIIRTQSSASDRASLKLLAATCMTKNGGTNRMDTSIIRKFSILKMQATPPRPMEKNKNEEVVATIPSSSGPKVSWPSLQAGQFRHPLDSQATIAIQRLFPFENVVRQSMGGMLEQMVYLDNMSNGIKVGTNQLPKIYKRFVVSSYRFRLSGFLVWNRCISNRHSICV